VAVERSKYAEEVQLLETFKEEAFLASKEEAAANAKEPSPTTAANTTSTSSSLNIPAALFTIEHKSYVIWFNEILFMLLKDVQRRYLRTSQQYFMILKNFALLGSEERQYLVSRQIITKALDYIVQEPMQSSPSPASSPSISQQVSNRSGAVGFPPLFSKAASLMEKGKLQISGPISLSPVRSLPNLNQVQLQCSLCIYQSNGDDIEYEDDGVSRNFGSIE